MRIDRKELKRLAKQRMKEAPIHPMLVTLVYGLVVFGAAMLVNLSITIPAALAASAGMMAYQGIVGGVYGAGVNPAMLALPLFLYILYALVSAVLQYGYTAYNLRVADGGESGCLDIFSGFPRVAKIIPMSLALAGFYILWGLAIFVPGMLLIFIAALVAGIGSAFFGGLLLIVIYIAIFVVLALVTMRYLFANHVLADDPEIGPLEAIRRSRALMKGRSGEGLLLQLSFLGWSLLAFGIYFGIAMVGGVLALTVFSNGMLGMAALAISIIVGMLAMVPLLLWLYPYVGTTISLYYRALSPRAPEQGEEPAPLPDPNTPWRPEGEQ